jgi:ATP-dependent exoDNAse (exonuclease V) beta subunit
MVDEFHETDPAQRKLLELLRCDDMVFVLDEKSAVGRFRGSDPDGSERYLIDTYSPTVITLETPHRGTPHMSAVQLRSESEEAQYIAGQIKRAHLLEGVAYSDMAIIVRSHGGAATAIRRALTASGVPVESEREAITSNASITPFLLLAKIATELEPLNLENCQRLLLSEFGGASSISLRRIRIALLQARDEESDLRSGTQMIIDAIDKGDIPIEEGGDLHRVHSLLLIARQSLEKPGAHIHDLLGAIWENATNADGEKIADAWLRTALRGGNRGAAADRDLDAMVQLFDSAARHIDRMPGAHPKIFLTEISKENIVSDLITAKGVRPDAVELLTVHSAKGREWNRVFVAGVQDGIWPNLKQRSTLLGAERLVERERYGEEQSDKPFNVITADNLAIDERRLFHVATTRARESLTVTAFAREDSAPSSYFADLQDKKEYEHITFDGERALTANALVASLRRALRGADAEVAAGILATLKQNSIEVADTDKWLGSRALSTDAPLYAEHELVPLSPSSAESFERCGLKWLLERNGGTAGDSSLALLGSVIHEYARLRVQNADITDEQLQEKLKESWPLITDSVGWISKTELKRATDMLKRFAQYHRENQMKVHGVELRFEYTLGRARVTGTVDRLQVTSDGKYYVVDFKTGEASGFKEAQANLQLACYQLAVVLDGFVEKLENTQDGGAHLVYLGHDTVDVAIRPRDPLKVETVQEEIATIVEKMALPVFTAKQNEYCGTCPVRTSCPLRLEGRTVIS